jgi:hypothetical protein
MAASEWLCHFIGIDSKKFSKKENCILESEIYKRILQEFWINYQNQYREYFYLIKHNFETGDNAMELYVIRCLLNDLLNNQLYTLSGVAYYTQIPVEIIEDLLIGHKTSPLVTFVRKLIELHKFAKPDIYQKIIKKITDKQEDEKKDP